MPSILYGSHRHREHTIFVWQQVNVFCIGHQGQGTEVHRRRWNLLTYSVEAVVKAINDTQIGLRSGHIGVES